jgi:hypothetical protein
MRMRTLACFLAVLALPLVSFSAERKHLEEILQKDALFFMRFSPSATEGEHGGYWKLYHDERVQEFLAKPIEKLKETFETAQAKAEEELGEAPPEFPFTKDELLDLAKGEILFAVENPAGGKFASPDDISALMVLDLGGQAPKMKAFLSSLVAKGDKKLHTRERDFEGETIVGLFPKDLEPDAPKAARNPFNYAISGQYLVVAQKLGAMKRLLSGLKNGTHENISKNANYQRVLKEAEADAEFIYFLDIERLYPALPEPAAPAAAADGVQAPQPGAPNYRTVLKALGMDALKCIGAWMKSNAEGGSNAGYFIYNPGEQRGLFKLLASSPKKMDIPGFLPKHTSSYQAIRISPREFYDFVLQAADEVSPGYSAIIEMWVTTVRENHGIDIPNELLSAIGHQLDLISMDNPNRQDIDFGNMNPFMAQMLVSAEMGKMMVYSAEITDPVKLQTIIEVMVALMAERAPQFATIQAEPVGDFTIFRLGPQQQGGMQMPGIPAPCYMFTKDRFFFGTNSDTLKTIATQLNNPTGGMAEHPLLVKGMKELLDKPAVSIACANEGLNMRQASFFAKAALQLMEAQRQQMAAVTAPPGEEEAQPQQKISDFIDFSKWPPDSIFQEYLGFMVGRLYPVKDGFRYEGISVPNPDAPDPTTKTAETAAK